MYIYILYLYSKFIFYLYKGGGGIRDPEIFLAPSADKQTGEETLTERLESSGSHQSAQTVNSSIYINRRVKLFCCSIYIYIYIIDDYGELFY